MACMASSGGDDSTKTMVTSTGYCFSDASAVGGGGGGNQSIIQSQVVNQYHHHHQSNFDFNPHEMYGLTSGMELLGFPQKNNLVVHHHQVSATAAADTNSVMWKEFFGKSAVPSTSKAANINEQEFNYHQSEFSTGGMSDTASETLMGGTNETWHHQHQHDDNNNNNRSVDHHVQFLDDPSLRSCVVFPTCDQGGGNERPNQGLSLSLGSSDPARIGGLQSFELRQQQQQHESDHGFFFGGNKSSTLSIQQQQLMQQQGGRGGIMGKVESINNLGGHFHHQNQFHIRSSKYLAPAQELLNEFCNLGTKQQLDSCTQKLKIHKTNQQQLDQSSADQETDAMNTSSRIQSLYSTDLLELQKRKSKLLQMLEEVDRRYKHYCDQMKGVVSSFEAVAGNGAAMVYSTLASKAMSRHFRSLRDGIIGQIKATKKALGEKDTVTPGGTRGETPRLRVLDQTLRQQRAFQQMSMMETHPWRPQRGLPERAVSVLRAWLFEHFLHPYPSEVDKHILSRQTGLTRSQVSNWFINARVRLWKPMVEEMYVEETKEQENMGTTSSDINNNINIGGGGGGGDETAGQQQNPANSKMVAVVDEDDQKPTHEQLVRIDSECLSSIIHNNPSAENILINKNTSNLHDDNDDVVEHVQMHHHHNHNSYGNTFGAVELDFSYNHNFGNRGGGGGRVGVVGGGNVSLTLGLQQHGGSGGGGGLAFSPGTGNHHQQQQQQLYYSTREHNIESCPSINVPVGGVQYSSLLDTEITQNLPYRNLMGAQLLHDLAG